MSISHWIIVAIVVFVIFGAGKLPRLMEDVAHGIKAFKRGMKEDDTLPPSKKTDDINHPPV